MFIDLHMHEMTYSKDSFLTLEQIVDRAKQKGLQGICITDHDSMGLQEYAAEYAQKRNFPIFVGIEYYSLEGDILAFGIEEYPKERVAAQTFIQMVKEQGGICFSAHPFRSNNRGLKEHLMQVKGLDGIEVLNGSTTAEANQLAADYAERLGILSIGASDCHVPEQIGIYATYFPEQVQTISEFINVLKSGRCQPAYYKEGRYYLWDGRKRAQAL